MAKLWLCIAMLVFLALDIINRKKTKHKTRGKVFIVVEVVAAVGAFLWWLLTK